MSLASQLVTAFTAVGNYLRDNVVPYLVPGSGTTGHVLTKQAVGYGWQAPSVGIGGGAVGEVTITLPNGKGVREWSEVVVATGVLTDDLISVRLAAGDDTNENEPADLDLSVLSAKATADDELTITATFTSPQSGPINIIWRVD